MLAGYTISLSTKSKNRKKYENVTIKLNMFF